METEKKTPQIPTNTFEARNWVHDYSKLTRGARLLAYELLAYWNLDGTGKCYPSLATLKDKTGYTSLPALRKLIDELEASGEWAVVRGEYGASTHFYPMFVKNAKTQYLGQGEIQKKLRRELDAKRKQQATGKHKKEYVVPKTTVVKTSVSTSTDSKETKMSLPETIHPSKENLLNWMDANDEDLIDSYTINRQRVLSQTPKLKPLEILEVLEKGDIQKYKIEQTVGAVDDGSPKVYVRSILESLNPTTYPERWIARYNSNYGRKFTHTEIWNIYLELILNDNGDMTKDRLNAIETAMWVLGKNGVMPTVKTAKSLLYPVTKLTGNFIGMKEQYEETYKGRKISEKLWDRSHYFAEVKPKELTGE